jgi:hypothetical protein
MLIATNCLSVMACSRREQCWSLRHVRCSGFKAPCKKPCHASQLHIYIYIYIYIYIHVYIHTYMPLRIHDRLFNRFNNNKNAQNAVTPTACMVEPASTTWSGLDVLPSASTHTPIRAHPRCTSKAWTADEPHRR